MELEEAIEQCKEKARTSDCPESVNEYRQMVSWLTELSVYRRGAAKKEQNKSVDILRPIAQYIVLDGPQRGRMFSYSELPDDLKQFAEKPVTNEEQMQVLRSLERDMARLTAFVEAGVRRPQPTPADDGKLKNLEQQVKILSDKVVFWQGLVKDISTVLGNSTDMFHECMSNWITRMVDDDDEAHMRSLANSIVNRLHSVRRSEWEYPLLCVKSLQRSAGET